MIGLLVADFEPFSTEVLKGAADAIRGTGYELVAYSAGGRFDEHVGWERRYLSRVMGTLVDGAVLVTPTVTDVQYDGPVVAVDPHTGRSSLPTVAADNLQGARMGVDHLLEPGAPPHRHGHRPRRPGVGPAARARLPRGARRGRRTRRRDAARGRRVRPRAGPGRRPDAARPARAADRDLRGQRHLGAVDPRGRRRAGGRRPRPAVRGRLRQHPRVGAVPPAVDDRPAADAPDGARRDRDARRPDRRRRRSTTPT